MLQALRPFTGRLSFAGGVGPKAVYQIFWHEAVVTAIFKKGDAPDCSNYRPISLSAVGYKLSAIIILKRLREGGAEQRIWPTQFGFRTGHGTDDALFLARRVLDEAWAQKNGQAIFLALDWAILGQIV